MEQRLSVIGLGKLGSSMLVCFAHKGWQVIGVDLNGSFVSMVNEGKSPVYEPGVEKLLKENKDRILATRDTVEAFNKTDVSFIIVPTPSTPEGDFSIKYVLSVVRKIGTALKNKKTYHLIVVTSTVMPGDTDKVKTMLENISGKTCGSDFGVCYNPDFIALGTVIKDFLNPDMILIGQSDEKAGRLLEDIHRKLIDNDPEVHRMSFQNAELSKIGLNAYCTLKINFANVIGEICENIPDGDSDKVLGAIGADKRVGKVYFRAGLSPMGPCFPRDNRAFKYASDKLGVRHTYAGITDGISLFHKKSRIPSLLFNILIDRKLNEIAVLGLTYKNDVPIVDESVPVEVIKQLSHGGVRVKTYDPAGMSHAEQELKGYTEVKFTGSVEECLSGVSLCFVGTEWSEFKELTLQDFLFIMGDEPVIFDAWGIYRGTEIETSSLIDYRRIGKKSERVFSDSVDIKYK